MLDLSECDTARDLPVGFESLIPFLVEWENLETEDQRYQLREQKSMVQLQEFYDAVAPVLESIFHHLDQFPYDQLPAPEERLFRLALGLAEVAQAIEVIGEPTVPTLPAGYLIQVVRPKNRVRAGRAASLPSGEASGVREKSL